MERVEGYTDRSIFIPAVGYYDGSTLTDGTNGWYWTSDNKYGTYSNTARVYGLKPSDVGGYYGKKYVGNSVRPVKDDGTVKPSGISMRAYSHLTMFRGQTFDFNPTVLPENVDEDYQDITWNVTGPAISSSSQGKVYASSVGTGYVVAKTCDDLAVNCNVNVVDAYLLSSSGTANCYICSSKGTYRFKTVKGNSTESVGDVKGVKVLWKTFNNGSTPGINDLIVDDNVWLSDEWIIFKTADTFQEGNVVIAAYSDEECTYGNILWSWHIWLTSANLTALQKTYSNSAGIMMDRNIGALKDNDDGMLYQWGRKDPFIPKYSYLDEDNDRTWGDMKSTAVWPSAVSKTSETCTLQYVTSNPMTFIKGSGSVESEPFGYSWSSSKSITDPCPPGWKVPNGGNSSLWAKAGIQNRNEWIEGTWHDYISPYTNSSSYFKISYYNSWNGSLVSPSWNNTNFSYWSNTSLSNTEASSFYVYYVDGDDDNYLTINTNYSQAKTYGYPVRCCKE